MLTKLEYWEKESTIPAWKKQVKTSKHSICDAPSAHTTNNVLHLRCSSLISFHVKRPNPPDSHQSRFAPDPVIAVQLHLLSYHVIPKHTHDTTMTPPLTFPPAAYLSGSPSLPLPILVPPDITGYQVCPRAL